MSASSSLLAGGRAFDDAHDVGLLHDQELLSLDLDLGARPFAEQDAIAFPHVQRHELALLIARTRAHRNDLALDRLFLGRIWYNDAALGLLLGREPANHDPVVQRTELHTIASSSVELTLFRQGLRGGGRPTRPVALGLSEC